MEEQWSPLRMFMGAVLLILLIAGIYFGIFVNTMLSDFNTYQSQCLAESKKNTFHLQALAQNDISLCANTLNPLFCEVEVSGDVSLCDTLDQSQYKNYCLFSATKDMQYCPDNSNRCKILAAQQSSDCDQVASYLKEECLAFVQKDTQRYLRSQESSCSADAWSTIGFERNNLFYCRFIKDNDLEADCRTDIRQIVPS